MLRVRDRRYISQFQGMKKGDTVGEPRVLHRDNYESRDVVSYRYPEPRTLQTI